MGCDGKRDEQAKESEWWVPPNQPSRHPFHFIFMLNRLTEGEG